jgi:hypothetical protein
MHRGNKFVASLFLSAALLAPVGAFAMPAAQEDEHHDQHVRRVYDPYHKDYHNWDKVEDDTYRHWLEGRHVAYVDFEHLKKKDQEAYWNWRHSH